jgi:hypothetical protein
MNERNNGELLGKRAWRIMRSRRAVSRVISFVFLVTVSLTIAVTTSYGTAAISSRHTRFEKVEIKSAYCEYKTSFYDFNGTNADSYEIRLNVKNAGSTDTSIIGVYVNSKAISGYGSGAERGWIVAYEDTLYKSNKGKNPKNKSEFRPPIDFEDGDTITLSPGSSKDIIILIAEDSGDAYSFSKAGVVVEVSIYSGTGNVYMKMLTLT